MKDEPSRIIFHYLPSGAIEQPSTAFSILKSHMEHNGYQAFVYYWNIIFQSALKDITTKFELVDNNNVKNNSLLSLSPFLYIIAKSYKDRKSQKRVADLVKSCYPEMIIKDSSFFDSYLKESSKVIIRIFEKKIQDNFRSQNTIHGFTARFDQWIPSIILSKSIKKLSPLAPIIIGGFDSKEESISVMKIVDSFDFAIWGEGEHSLLSLCENLNNNQSSL